jgi:hypothetical protein
VLQVVLHPQHFVQILLLGDEHLRFRVVQDVRHLRPLECRIDRPGRDPDAHRAEVGVDELGDVREHQADHVAPGHSEPTEQVPELRGEFVQVAIGHHAAVVLENEVGALPRTSACRSMSSRIVVGCMEFAGPMGPSRNSEPRPGPDPTDAVLLRTPCRIGGWARLFAGSSGRARDVLRCFHALRAPSPP